MISNIFSEVFIEAIAWTILHSFWQIAIISLLMSFVLKRFEKKNSKLKYGIGLSAMLTSVIVAFGTFMFYIFEGSGTRQLGVNFIEGIQTLSVVNESVPSAMMNFNAFVNEHLILVTSIWLSGVVLFTIKLIGGYVYLQQFTLGKIEASDELKYTVSKLKSTLGINKKIQISESNKVTSPMVIGFVKPIILIPVGLVNQLSTKEVEAILLHELAHIMRYDFIINLCCSLAEVIFFYHPGVWWISHQIKLERENCCDDVAIQHLGNSLAYAKVLVKLESLKQLGTPSVALGISKNRKSLLHRVKRILNQPNQVSNMKEKMIATVFVLTMVFAFSSEGMNFFDRSKELIEPTRLTNELEMLEPIHQEEKKLNVIIDTFPKKEKGSYMISKSNGEEDILLKMEDGEIVELRVDGKEIPKEEYDEHDQLLRELKPRRSFGDISTMFLKEQHPMTLYADSIELWFEDGNLDSMLAKGMPHIKMKNFEFPNHFNGQMRSFGLSFDTLMKGFKPDMNFDEIEMSENLEELLGIIEGQDFQQLKSLDGLFENFDGHPFGQDLDIQFLDKGNFLSGNKMSDQLARELNRDGLLIIGENNKIELSGKYLKINGDKQPENIWRKYKALYEENTGAILTRGSKIELEIIGKKSKRLFKSI